MTLTTRVSSGIYLVVHAMRTAKTSSNLLFALSACMTMSYIALHVPTTLFVIERMRLSFISYNIRLCIEIYAVMHALLVQLRVKWIYVSSYDERGVRNGYRKVHPYVLVPRSENTGVHITGIEITMLGDTSNWREDEAVQTQIFKHMEGTLPNRFLIYLSGFITSSTRTWQLGKVWWFALQSFGSPLEKHAHENCPWICWAMLRVFGKVIVMLAFTCFMIWTAVSFLEPLIYAVYDSGCDLRRRMRKERLEIASDEENQEMKAE